MQSLEDSKIQQAALPVPAAVGYFHARFGWRVGERRLYRLIEKGLLPSLRVGRRVFVVVDTIEASLRDALGGAR